MSPGRSRVPWRRYLLLLCAQALLLVGLRGSLVLQVNALAHGALRQAHPDTPPFVALHAPSRPSRTTPALGRSPASLDGANWSNLFPHLMAVSGVSNTEAWAVGDYGHLLHFTAGTWMAGDPPELRGQFLTDLKMLSSTQGWIAAGAQAFAYDGTTWITRSSGLTTTQPLLRLAPRSANDVWGVTPQRILHWDGTYWQPVGPILSDTVTLYDITLGGSSEGWAVGSDGPAGALLLHYDGANWTRVAVPSGLALFDHVAAPGPGEVWLTAQTSYPTGFLYHYAAGQWANWPNIEQAHFAALYLQSPTQGWASDYEGGILHWDGRTWSLEYQGSGGGALNGLGGAGAQVWAVGVADMVVNRTTSGAWVAQRGGPTPQLLDAVGAASLDDAWAFGERGVALHYSSGTWHNSPTGLGATFLAVQMLTPDDGYAVGATEPDGIHPADGVIAHWDGVSWRSVLTATGSPVLGIAMLGGREGWAVGAGVWHFTDGIWQAVSCCPTPAVLHAIAMDSPTHGWAVGEGQGGVLLEYTGATWVDRSNQIPRDLPLLYDIALAPGGQDGWAVGADTQGTHRVILDLHNGAWTLDPFTPDFYLTKVALDASGEAWAVGCGGVVHEVGGRWQQVNAPASYPCLFGLSILAGRGGWAVGEGGAILQYNPLAPGQRFFDVPVAHPFYSYIDYLAAHNIVSGYADNTYRPANPVTRAQLTKMIAQALNWPLDPPATPTFADVPLTYPFYQVIEAAVSRGVIAGYSCGGPGEPCDATHRPYFRPNAEVTRGQLSKIIVLAKGWGELVPEAPTFRDVLVGHPFYGFIERAVQKLILNGYGCGGPGEPCDPARQGYFRPGNSATRGQMSKILDLALTQP